MSKYIDVDDITYNYIIPSTTTNTPCTLAVTKDKIDAMPTVYVAPVTHGYWTDTGSGQECSVCKEIQYGYDSGRHYCPNCGAKMQEQIQFQIIQDMYDLGFADKMG